MLQCLANLNSIKNLKYNTNQVHVKGYCKTEIYLMHANFPCFFIYQICIFVIPISEKDSSLSGHLQMLVKEGNTLEQTGHQSRRFPQESGIFPSFFKVTVFCVLILFISKILKLHGTAGQIVLNGRET